MSWLETLFLADVLSSEKKTAQKKRLGLLCGCL